MVSHSSVQFALMHRYARDPEYVKAVIRSYIEVKKARGRQVHDICMKLNYIEQEVRFELFIKAEMQLPQFAESFHAVRAEYRLPPSRVLVPPRPLSETRHSSLYSGVGSRMAQSSPSIARRSTETRRPSSASVATAQRPLPAEFQVRPDANAEEEAAPPPYARQDPEPDSTRILQERLAAEASNLPPDTPPSSRPRLPSSTTSPPTLVWATPTGSPANPQHIRRASQPARPVSPPHPPEDDEIARAYEENQMEEAKRASIIAERERQEVEEAMRLSLADAEGENAEAGPSRPAHSLIDMDEGGQQRPASISATLSQPEASLSNRNISSGTSANPDKHLGRAMQHLSIPGGPSLLDSDDEDGAQQLPPMVPQKTGAVIQSRNPFLSASEDHVIQDPPTTKDPAIPPKEIIPAQPTANSTTGRALPRIPRDRTSDSQALSANENASLPVKQEQELLTSHASYLDVSEHPVSADPLHTLSYYQIIFLIDDSASIAGPRWDEAKRAFSQVAETAMKYSTEGIDVYFTNSKRVGRELRVSDFGDRADFRPARMSRSFCQVYWREGRDCKLPYLIELRAESDID